MAYSRDEKLFWKLLEGPQATLVVDNDCCYIQHSYDADTEEYDSTSFDFGPKDLIFIFGAKLGLDMENC